MGQLKTAPGVYKMDSLKLDFSKVVPPHNCKMHSKILEEVHSVNARHNITIYRKSICKICGKVFEKSDPDGIK